MNTIPDTEEHKEEPLDSKRNLKFKARIAAERKAEAEELKLREEKEKCIVKYFKPKPVCPKPKRKYKKRVKKENKVEKKPLISLKILPIKKELKLPVYKTKIEVNEFNKFKVDYIRKQAFLCKDKERKMIYQNALLKYDLSNYNPFKN